MTYEPVEERWQSSHRPHPNNFVRASLFPIPPLGDCRPGTMMKLKFVVTALQEVRLKHLLVGYTCQSSIELLKQDIKLYDSNDGVYTSKNLVGAEHHFLVNDPQDILEEPENLIPGDCKDFTFSVKIPEAGDIYDSCDKHTLPSRDGFFHEIEESQRTLPPPMEVKISGRPVIRVAHYIKVEIGLTFNGEENWRFLMFPVNPWLDLIRIPRNWDHLVDDEERFDNSLTETRSTMKMVKIRSSIIKGFATQGDAFLHTTFSDFATINSPTGPIHREILTNRHLNEFLQLSVSLPVSLIKSRHYRRAVHLMGLSVVLKRMVTLKGGIYWRPSRREESHYWKNHKTYSEIIALGSRTQKMKLSHELDKENKMYHYVIPEKALKLHTPREGMSTMACNFSVDYSLVIVVKLMVGTSAMVELSDEVPIILSPLIKSSPRKPVTTCDKIVTRAKSWLKKGIFREDLASSDEAEEDHKDGMRVEEAMEKVKGRLRVEEARDEMRSGASQSSTNSNHASSRRSPFSTHVNTSKSSVDTAVDNRGGMGAIRAAEKEPEPNLEEVYEGVSTLVENAGNDRWDTFFDAHSSLDEESKESESTESVKVRSTPDLGPQRAFSERASRHSC